MHPWLVLVITVFSSALLHTVHPAVAGVQTGTRVSPAPTRDQFWTQWTGFDFAGVAKERLLGDPVLVEHHLTPSATSPGSRSSESQAEFQAAARYIDSPESASRVYTQESEGFNLGAVVLLPPAAPLGGGENGEWRSRPGLRPPGQEHVVQIVIMSLVVASLIIRDRAQLEESPKSSASRCGSCEPDGLMAQPRSPPFFQAVIPFPGVFLCMMMTDVPATGVPKADPRPPVGLLGVRDARGHREEPSCFRRLGACMVVYFPHCAVTDSDSWREPAGAPTPESGSSRSHCIEGSMALGHGAVFRGIGGRMESGTHVSASAPPSASSKYRPPPPLPRAMCCVGVNLAMCTTACS